MTKHQKALRQIVATVKASTGAGAPAIRSALALIGRVSREALNQKNNMVLTFKEYKFVWSQLTEEEKNEVRLKAAWEHMTMWDVLNEWPDLRRGN